MADSKKRIYTTTRKIVWRSNGIDKEGNNGEKIKEDILRYGAKAKRKQYTEDYNVSLISHIFRMFYTKVKGREEKAKGKFLRFLLSPSETHFLSFFRITTTVRSESTTSHPSPSSSSHPPS
jgi:hypothetical protein